MMQPLIALDQLLNTLFGGWADETISARAYRLSSENKRWAAVRYVIDHILFFWQEEHCLQSYLSEANRRQLPPEYRECPITKFLDTPVKNPVYSLFKRK